MFGIGFILMQLPNPVHLFLFSVYSCRALATVQKFSHITRTTIVAPHYFFTLASYTVPPNVFVHPAQVDRNSQSWGVPVVSAQWFLLRVCNKYEL